MKHLGILLSVTIFAGGFILLPPSIAKSACAADQDPGRAKSSRPGPENIIDSVKRQFCGGNFEVPLWLRHCAQHASWPDEGRPPSFNPPTKFNKEVADFELADAETLRSFGKVNKVELTEADKARNKALLDTSSDTLAKFLLPLQGRSQTWFRKTRLEGKAECYVFYNTVPDLYRVMVTRRDADVGLGGAAPILFLDSIFAGHDLRGGGYGPGLFAYCDVTWDSKKRLLAAYGCNIEVLFWNTYEVSKDNEVTKIGSFNSRMMTKKQPNR